ncbi:MAG: response regulator [Leptospirales bacterium]|nr:response regulator [Leptospirales bacterium]
MKTVLAVDDSRAMRSMVQQTLESGGFTVLLAEHGKEALATLSNNKIDLIVTDINMPIMDGLTFIREVRKLDTNIPILALTTEAEAGIKQTGNGLGADGWIVKPFQPAQFLDIVRQMVE